MTCQEISPRTKKWSCPERPVPARERARGVKGPLCQPGPLWAPKTRPKIAFVLSKICLKDRCLFCLLVCPLPMLFLAWRGQCLFASAVHSACWVCLAYCLRFSLESPAGRCLEFVCVPH